MEIPEQGEKWRADNFAATFGIPPGEVMRLLRAHGVDAPAPGAENLDEKGERVGAKLLDLVDRILDGSSRVVVEQRATRMVVAIQDKAPDGVGWTPRGG